MKDRDIAEIVVDLMQREVVVKREGKVLPITDASFNFGNVLIECTCGKQKVFNELVDEDWYNDLISQRQERMARADVQKLSDGIVEDNPEAKVIRDGTGLRWKPRENPWYCSDKCATVGGIVQ